MKTAHYIDINNSLDKIDDEHQLELNKYKNLTREMAHILEEVSSPSAHDDLPIELLNNIKSVLRRYHA